MNLFPVWTFRFISKKFPWTELMDVSQLVFSFRLFAHSDDPDIDDPFEVPPGHTLGKPGKTYIMAHTNLLIPEIFRRMNGFFYFLRYCKLPPVTRLN